MKFVTLAAIVLGLSMQAFAKESRITGPAAAEMYERLDVLKVGVHDEHGGPDFAMAKYGKMIGCQKDLGTGQVECWIRE